MDINFSLLVLLPYSPVQLYVYFVALNRLKIIRNLEGRFEEAIIAYLFLVNLVPIIIIPMMWYEARKVAKLLNHWADFEVWLLFNHLLLFIKNHHLASLHIPSLPRLQLQIGIR